MIKVFLTRYQLQKPAQPLHTHYGAMGEVVHSRGPANRFLEIEARFVVDALHPAADFGSMLQSPNGLYLIPAAPDDERRELALQLLRELHQ